MRARTRINARVHLCAYLYIKKCINAACIIYKCTRAFMRLHARIYARARAPLCACTRAFMRVLRQPLFIELCSSFFRLSKNLKHRQRETTCIYEKNNFYFRRCIYEKSNFCLEQTKLQKKRKIIKQNIKQTKTTFLVTKRKIIIILARTLFLIKF